MKQRFLGHPGKFLFSRWSLRSYISNKFPGDATSAAGSHTLRTTAPQEFRAKQQQLTNKNHTVSGKWKNIQVFFPLSEWKEAS